MTVSDHRISFITLLSFVIIDIWLCSSVCLFEMVMQKNAFKSEDRPTRHRKMHGLFRYFIWGGGGRGYLFVPWAYRISRWVVSSRYCVFGINNTLSPLLRLYRDFHVKQILRHTAISSVYIYIYIFILLIKIINGRIAFLHPNPHIYQVLTLLSNFKWMPAKIEV